MKNFLSKTDILYQLVNLKQITFEITDACNLKCKYCGYGEFYNDYDKRENTNLPIEKASAILDYLSDLWQSNINTSTKKCVDIGFYGGEPLLNVGFMENVIEYINQKLIPNRIFTYSMTTNAMLLDKYMDFIAKHNFSLLISLDGDEQSQSYRVDHAGINSFERVMKNVKLLREKYPDYFAERVNFNAVLHNRSTYEGVYRFIKNEFDKTPNITELNNMGIRDDMKETFMATYRNTYESLMQSENYSEIEKDLFIKSGSYQSVTTFLHQYGQSVFRDYNELLYGKPPKYKIPTGTCLPFSKKMFVTVNGKILPCERIGCQFSMGKITAENVVQLDCEQIADQHNARLNKICMQCKTCKITKSCIQCIYNLEDLDHNPICKGHANQQDFEQYAASQMAFLAQHPEDYYKIMEEIIIE